MMPYMYHAMAPAAAAPGGGAAMHACVMHAVLSRSAMLAMQPAHRRLRAVATGCGCAAAAAAPRSAAETAAEQPPLELTPLAISTGRPQLEFGAEVTSRQFDLAKMADSGAGGQAVYVSFTRIPPPAHPQCASSSLSRARVRAQSPP